MNELQVITNFLATSVLCGLMGLSLMTAVISFARRFEPVAVGPVRAVGSLFTGSMESAKAFGWLVHFAASMAFGMLYTFLLMSVTPPFEILYLPLSIAIGAAHGFFVFFLLIPSLAEHHPIAAVREQGGAIGLVYVFAHIAYGAGVGAMFLALSSVV